MVFDLALSLDRFLPDQVARFRVQGLGFRSFHVSRLSLSNFARAFFLHFYFTLSPGHFTSHVSLSLSLSLPRARTYVPLKYRAVSIAAKFACFFSLIFCF
jgi:hypothetical protein